MNNRARRKHRGLALGAAALLAFSSLAVTTTAALADEIPGAIDTQENGSITVHKFSNPNNGAQNPDGTGTNPSSPSAPIQGVVFEYCTISGFGVDGANDLFDGTNDGWDKLTAITDAQMIAAAAPGGTSLSSYTLTGCTDFAPTNSAGAAQAGDLDLGAYFVREKSTANATDAAGNPVSVGELSAPFIVTLPTPADNAGSSDGLWVYDVNVYPKNTVVQKPRKNIDDQPANGVTIGSTVGYSVETLIPALDKDDSYKWFVLTDTLDAKLTPGSAADVTVTVGGTALAAGDFTAAYYGQTLKVSLTNSGLAKLQAGERIVVAFDATVNAVGTIKNEANVNLNGFDLDGGTPQVPGEPTNPTNPNDPGVPEDPNDPNYPTDGTPSTSVDSRWGQLSAIKVSEGGNADGLEGAEFSLWMAPLSAVEGVCEAYDDQTWDRVENADGSELVLSSGADGAIAHDALWVGDTKKQTDASGNITSISEAGHDYNSRCYVLVETKAPAGFVLPTGADAVSYLSITTGEATAVQATIVNAQQAVPGLPLTGAQGKMILIIGGSALFLIALGGALMVVRSRRAQA